MRTVFLSKDDATKQSDNSYTLQVSRPNDHKVKSFEVQSAVVSYAPVQLNAADHTVISALNPCIWLRMADTSKITPAGAVEGSNVATITSVGPPGVTFIASSNTAVKYRKIGIVN